MKRYCRICWGKKGKVTPATEEVGGVWYCSDCFTEIGKEKTMPAKKEIDWNAVQAERDAGATTTALAEKYEVSTPTICAHTHPANGKSQRKPATKKAAANGKGVGQTHSPISLMIDLLTKKREKIDRAIEALQEV